MKKIVAIRIAYATILFFLFAPLCFGLSWDNPTDGVLISDCSTQPIPTMAGTQILVDGVLKATVTWPGNTWDHRQLAPGTYVLTTVAVSSYGNVSGNCATPNPTLTVTVTAADHQAWVDENTSPGCTFNLK